MALHFEFETRHTDRISAALNYCKTHRLHQRLFGEHSRLVTNPPVDASQSTHKDYRALLQSHQALQREYSVMRVPGITEIRSSIIAHARDRIFSVDLAEVIRHIKVPVADGVKRRAIQCCFQAKNGSYLIWYYGGIRDFSQKAEEFAHNAAAYTYHQCIRWGWSKEDAQRLVERGFEGYAARTAQTSTWDRRNNCVIRSGSGCRATLTRASSS